jgi:hypothetical protein
MEVCEQTETFYYTFLRTTILDIWPHCGERTLVLHLGGVDRTHAPHTHTQSIINKKQSPFPVRIHQLQLSVGLL